MASADIVICAAGTSVWDLMTLGKTIVTTTVMPNQIPIIERLEDDGLVLSLGDAHHWTTPAMDSLMTLISQQKTRVGMARRCWDTVDGHGAQRIARYLDGRERNA
jgi:spore coat polysaccharide biosynthesis predicted glycosyltransferase SpsG